ncbi:EG45-like domain containing protein [Rhodamnia argentea]|uniref:EG45-like domain containing protein n=1 Tax=Rhodamnia argentea TaxID=178133 RepID=A0A8B8Q7I7_9MYRT|nr:EG45-like domain containing protein [Rhodamnia argentea]
MKLSSIGTPLLSPFILVLLLLLTVPPHLSRADVGTGAHYSPPYTPTACFGNDPAQFPSSNFFAAAGEGIWDNGASCGRQYLVRCISASVSGTCVPGKTIQVRIVDRALSSSSRPSSSGATVVLSTTAFGAITKLSAAAINVEYQQV